MYTITKQFSFCAAHALSDLPADHPCAAVHGHNYVVTVELSSKELNNVGFVRDYRALSIVKDYIDTRLDHKLLNAALGDLNPTAENIAKHIYDTFKKALPELTAVEVSETPKTNARYEA